MGIAKRSAGIAVAVALAVACGGSRSPKIEPAPADAGGGGGAPSPPPPPAPVVDAGGDRPGVNPGRVACGADSCDAAGEVCCYQRRVGGGGFELVPTCQSPNDACTGPQIACDETADCPAGEVCCAELVRDEAAATSCRPSCVTGLPRTQVCKSDGECESASCRAYDCGGRFGDIELCAEPEGCR